MDASDDIAQLSAKRIPQRKLLPRDKLLRLPVFIRFVVGRAATNVVTSNYYVM